MPIITIHVKDVQQCVPRMQEALAECHRPEMILFFASSRYDLREIDQAFSVAYPTSSVIGCSTAGEFSSEQMTEGSIVAMAIPSDIVARLAVTLIPDVSLPGSTTHALQELEQKLGVPVRSLDPQYYAGLILIDGLSCAEERVMDEIGNVCDIPFVGGAAGDDLKFQCTRVCANGQVFEHGAVLAILNLPGGYRVLKTQSFRSTGRKLIATQVDEEHRVVYSFDGQPAPRPYAEALGVDWEGLPAKFMSHPLGLMMGDEPYVRSPRRITPGGAIEFYCNVKEGMQMDVLEETDIIADTRKDLESVTQSSRPAGIVVFNCILRALELKDKQQCEAFCQIFSGIPTIGFNTYGEEYTGHINQTATLLLFLQPAC